MLAGKCLQQFEVLCVLYTEKRFQCLRLSKDCNYDQQDLENGGTGTKSLLLSHVALSQSHFFLEAP